MIRLGRPQQLPKLRKVSLPPQKRRGVAFDDATRLEYKHQDGTSECNF